MDIKSQLNPHQYEAADSEAQYLRIIAGAGTGKTRTLTYRVASLITKGYAPSRMVAITFTNKAAKEMQVRVDGLLAEEGFATLRKPLISTFHGFCYRFLKKEIASLEGFNKDFSIADDEDQNTIYKGIFSKMTKGDSKDFTKAVTGKIADLKTDGIFPGEVKPSMIPLGSIYNFEELTHVYFTYQEFLFKQNLLDFDDLLMFTLKILKANPTIQKIWQSKYDIFLIDEFQDTNTIQYDIVKALLGPKTMLTVVGDPDQTIYTWRGAKNAIIKDRLSKDFPSLQTVILDDNYRSTQSILNAANSLIRHNSDRLPKDLKAHSGEDGEKVEYTKAKDNETEAYLIANKIHQLLVRKEAEPKDIAVIYRANYLSNCLERQLTAYKIPYVIYGGLKFYDRAEIKDALAYLKLLVNPDDFSFRRTLQSPTKGIGEVTLAKAESMKDLSPDDVYEFDLFRKYPDELGLNKSTKIALLNFYQAFDAMKLIYQSHGDNDELMSGIRNYFNVAGFTDYVHREDQKAEDKLSYTAASSTSKVDNVNEFLRSLEAYLQSDVVGDDGNPHAPTLEEFLMDVALQSDQDTMNEDDNVSLMTGHVSKGLEFPYVFVTGLVQGVFPTNHAINDNKAAIEEERRLLYVCLTRAKKKLYLSSFGGMSFYTNTPNTPSMFLKELNLLPEEEKNTAPKSDYQAYVGHNLASHSFFGSLSPNAKSILEASGPKHDLSPSDTYAVGDKVIHTSFGVGVVKEVYPDHKILVLFKEPYGEKKLMVGFKAFRKMKEGE
jgi:DNA helicase-2/ATP-dependent DNA helicase PcrA